MGWPDGILTGLLSAWFLSVIVSTLGVVPVINAKALITNAVFYAGLVGVLVTFLVARRISLDAAFGLRWSRWRDDVPQVALAGLAALPVVLAVQGTMALLAPEPDKIQPLLVFWKSAPSWTDRAMVVLLATVVAPLAEETIFRGYFFQTARKFVGTTWAMLFASLLFAGIHVHLPSLAGLFVLALAFNWVYVVTGSLWAPICMHAVFNSLNLVASLLWPGFN